MLKNIYIVKIKNLIFPFVFLVFTICLILFSKSNLEAAKIGLSLWANSVLPSLFPFFIATELLSHTDIIYIIGKKLNFIMKPLFNIRGEGCFALIMGIISGYPVGAKIVANFRSSDTCSKEECERLLSFTNNSGPLFIIGTIGISMFGNTSIGILLLITHILASITVGVCFRFYKNNSTKKNNNYISGNSNKKISNFKVKSNNASFEKNKNQQVNLSNLGGVIGESISSSISTILLVGGFVVLFSVIISILNSSKIIFILSTCFLPISKIFNIPSDFISPLITGFFEITNGINQIALVPCKQISINIILTSFLLGFGGISVLLQVWSVIAKTDISIKPYIIGKFMQGIFAVIYTSVFIYCIPIFQLNL